MKDDSLVSILNAASKAALVDLLTTLSARDPAIHRTCIETLKSTVDVTASVRRTAESSAAMAVWNEIVPILADLDAYGGGSHQDEDSVADGLYQLKAMLDSVILTDNDREALLDEILPYIRSGNSGMVDELYDVAYVASHNNDDHLRQLAERFEALQQEWPIEQAIRIYKQIGDDEKYLALRMQKMKYGLDFYDLVTFYWEGSEKAKALESARRGLEAAEGRIDELRMFLADHAKSEGDRATYLQYLFTQKMERLSLATYQEFEVACQKGEWEEYEPKILERLGKKLDLETVKIYLYRKEHDKALPYFDPTVKVVTFNYLENHEEYSIAAQLEPLYPEQILAYYPRKSGQSEQHCDPTGLQAQCQSCHARTAYARGGGPSTRRVASVRS